VRWRYFGKKGGKGERFIQRNLIGRRKDISGNNAKRGEQKKKKKGDSFLVRDCGGKEMKISTHLRQPVFLKARTKKQKRGEFLKDIPQP